MRKFIYIWTLVLIFAVSSKTYSQNLHFSQFYSNPVFLNPASSGVFDGKYRFSTNYRNQWSSVSVPFITSAIAFDMNFKKKAIQNDYFSGGFVLVNDIAGDGNLSTSKILPSLAYHKSLDKLGKHDLSFGLQAGISQKKVDLVNLTFPEQYNGSFFDYELPNYEQFINSTILNLDLSLGVTYNYYARGRMIGKVARNPDVISGPELQLGISLNRFNNPNQSFSDTKNFEGAQLVFHGRLGTWMTKNYNAYLLAMVIQQRSLTQVVIGADIEHDFETNKPYKMATIFGARYRYKDAVIALIGVVYKTWKFTASYDVNVSNLKTASNGRGAIEFSAIYIVKKHGGIQCPKFNSKRTLGVF